VGGRRDVPAVVLCRCRNRPGASSRRGVFASQPLHIAQLPLRLHRRQLVSGETETQARARSTLRPCVAGKRRSSMLMLHLAGRRVRNGVTLLRSPKLGRGSTRTAKLLGFREDLDHCPRTCRLKANSQFAGVLLARSRAGVGAVPLGAVTDQPVNPVGVHRGALNSRRCSSPTHMRDDHVAAGQR
jgi:hypothetical protein